MSTDKEYEDIISKLSRLASARDAETGNHMRRVSLIAQLIARELGQSAEYGDLILQAAPMHDIGKIGIPDRILLKPGRLSVEEWEIMKTHTTLGFEMLKDSSSPLLQLGAEIAHSHHEKFDGTGYPRGLVGNQISLAGRIVAVADEFDALLSVRPYKNAWSLTDALGVIRRKRGGHFDPACASVLLKRLDEVLAIRMRHADHVPTAANL